MFCLHFFYFTKALLGENRQRYLERLKERLERRQKRIEEGLDPDEEDEETMRLLEEEQAASTGNILRDLQNRFDEEKDALLRRLQVHRVDDALFWYFPISTYKFSALIFKHFLRDNMRVFNKKSKHFLFGDHLINSHNHFS